jgi:hypothetical protein
MMAARTALIIALARSREDLDALVVRTAAGPMIDKSLEAVPAV